MIRRLAIILLVALFPALASAAPSEHSRQLTKKANSLYASGKYREASLAFEEAYSARADAALLFNAAQSARLGGDLRRAQTLYSSYVSFHPDGANLDDAKRQLTQIDEKLRAEAAAEKPEPTAPTIVVTSTPPPPVPSDEKPKAHVPVYKRWWLWTAVVGGAAVVATGVTLGLVLGRPAPAWTNVQDFGPGVQAKTSALVQFRF